MREQAAEQSGWSQFRQELMKRHHLTAESIRLRDNWLIEQLLAQNQALLAKLEMEEGVAWPPETAQSIVLDS